MDTVVSMGIHIVDILGRPVSRIPEGQRLDLLNNLRRAHARKLPRAPPPGKPTLSPGELSARLGAFVESLSCLLDKPEGASPRIKTPVLWPCVDV